MRFVSLKSQQDGKQDEIQYHQCHHNTYDPPGNLVGIEHGVASLCQLAVPSQQPVQAEEGEVGVQGIVFHLIVLLSQVNDLSGWKLLLLEGKSAVGQAFRSEPGYGYCGPCAVFLHLDHLWVRRSCC